MSGPASTTGEPGAIPDRASGERAATAAAASAAAAGRRRPVGQRPRVGQGGQQRRSRRQQRPARAERSRGPSRGGRPDRPAADRPHRSGRRPRATPRGSRPRRVEPALPDDVTGGELDRAVRGRARRRWPSLNAWPWPAPRDGRPAARRRPGDRLRARHRGRGTGPGGSLPSGRPSGSRPTSPAGTPRRWPSCAPPAGSSGDHSHLPVMADCERGLGRPEKALEMAAAPEVARARRRQPGRDAHRGLRRPPRHGPARGRRAAPAGPAAAPGPRPGRPGCSTRTPTRCWPPAGATRPSPGSATRQRPTSEEETDADERLDELTGSGRRAPTGTTAPRPDRGSVHSSPDAGPAVHRSRAAAPRSPAAEGQARQAWQRRQHRSGQEDS